MNNPWGLLVTYRAIFGNLWHAAFGTRLRQIISLVILLIISLIGFNVEGDDASVVDVVQLNTAIKVSQFFEHENRNLAEQLEDEQRRRRLAEQTISALAENIKEQDEVILDQSQQIAFYRQLLTERGKTETNLVIRSFEIVPDYRDSYHQLSAVLVRSGADNKTFEGYLDLALSLVDSNGRTFEHQPVLDPGALDISFRYYHEAQAVFPIPVGTEILNAQLVLFNPAGNALVARTLQE